MILYLAKNLKIYNHHIHLIIAFDTNYTLPCHCMSGMNNENIPLALVLIRNMVYVKEMPYIPGFPYTLQNVILVYACVLPVLEEDNCS